MNSRYRYLVPNVITFLSLAAGVTSILLSATADLRLAAIFILISYVLDLLDGLSARRLQAGTEFGLQLDSLADMVSLGTAPAVLIFMHLHSTHVATSLVWICAIALPLAGAFRLARFNLLPPKTSGNTDSVGLTISTGGATIALAVLSDLAWPSEIFPDFAYIPLVLLIGFLMVSTISFPSVFWLFTGRRRNAILILLLGTTLLQMPFFNTWFVWNNAYLGISLARAGYRTFR